MGSSRAKAQRHKSPDLLYKYRDWQVENHKRMLTEGEIFLASPRTLNDPCDCHVILRHDWLSTTQRRKHCFKLVTRRWRDLHRSWRKALADCVAEKPDNELRKSSEVQNPIIDDRIGVFSLAADRESPRMWDRYANSSKGFCVGFGRVELEREMDVLCQSEDTLLQLFPVRYEKDPLIIPTLLNDRSGLIRKLTTKTLDWSYEREWRVLLLEQTQRPICVAETTIKEVLLGCEMGLGHVNEIVEILRKKRSHIPLLKAKRDSTSTGLCFEEIRY